jgi:hypothetical protein
MANVKARARGDRLMTQGKVLVYHASRDGYRQVAVVDVAGWEFDNASTDDVLEYAYRWTQNLDGSWSLKEGDDANDLVTVIDHVPGDWGYRSTSVNDAMVYRGQAYVVSGMGFTPHEFPVVKKEWFC